jgi:hypothetical protein
LLSPYLKREHALPDLLFNLSHEKVTATQPKHTSSVNERVIIDTPAGHASRKSFIFKGMMEVPQRPTPIICQSFMGK